MTLLHGTRCEDPDLLHQIVNQELLDRGLSCVVATPNISKKGIGVTFTYPARDTLHLQKSSQGKVFGRRLSKLTKTLVTVGAEHKTSLLVPKFVASACRYIEDNVETEGIYRKSGSQHRQKVIRAEIENGVVELEYLVPLPHVLDVTSLLKTMLRELPCSVIPRPLHSLLASCYTSNKPVENLQLSLLLLPRDHMALLTFLLHHLDIVASNWSSNKMCPSNLAIVLSPNLLPVQETVTNTINKHKKTKQVDINTDKMKMHTAILELLLRHSDKMGFLTPEIHQRYMSCRSLPTHHSYSEGEMIDDGPSEDIWRRTNKRVRKRSGSLSTVLTVMGKAIGLGKTIQSESASNDFKRPAEEDHNQSLSNKIPRMGSESTFTPKMGMRSFSVKRFRRKKSESKMKPTNVSVSHIVDISSEVEREVVPSLSPPLTRLSLTSMYKRSLEENSEDTVFSNVLVDNDNKMKIQYNEPSMEEERLVKKCVSDLPETFDEVFTLETLVRKSLENTTPDRVRRSGVRKDQMKTENEEASTVRKTQTEEVKPISSHTMEANMLPGIELGSTVKSRPCMRATRLQRGQPNSTSVGLVKPLASPVRDGDCGQGARSRIKVSFMGRDKPSVRTDGSGRSNTRSLEHDGDMSLLINKDSLINLKNINEDIEMNTGGEHGSYGCPVVNRDMFEDIECPEVFEERKEENNVMNEINNITINTSPRSPCLVPSVCITRTSQLSLENSYSQCSPVTRSQLKRKSHSFQFALPAEMKSPDSRGMARRRSWAFEPKYKNISRSGRSRNRRNSSVKDCVDRLESTNNVDMAEYLRSRPSVGPSAKKEVTERSLVTNLEPWVHMENNVHFDCVQPVLMNTESHHIIQSDNTICENWVDGATFFKDIQELNAPHCGRESVAKIREEIRGRVQDSVIKFSQTPHIGTTQVLEQCVTVASNLDIYTTASIQEQSPLYEDTSPVTVYVSTSRRSSIPPPLPKQSPPSHKLDLILGQNVILERKLDNYEDISTGSIVLSNSGSKGRLGRNRNLIDQSGMAGISGETKYLTIGFSGEGRRPRAEGTSRIYRLARSKSEQNQGRNIGGKYDICSKVEQKEEMESVSMAYGDWK